MHGYNETERSYPTNANLAEHLVLAIAKSAIELQSCQVCENPHVLLRAAGRLTGNIKITTGASTL